MKIINYLYIDDYFNKNRINTLTSMVQRLEDGKLLKITPQSSSQFEKIINLLQTELNNYDGLIIDLKLNDEPNDKGEISQTNAAPIAQFIRDSASEGKMKNLPIVLCSTDENIKIFYKKDFTSHDLFDMRFLKVPKDQKIWNSIIQELYALAEGYYLLEEFKGDFAKILAIEPTTLDSRILSRFDEESEIPSHEYAKYILKEMIFINGPLIEESILAARLGIDIRNSQDWEELITKYFSEAKYRGVFSPGWTRWWAHIIYKQFENITNKPLQILDAKEKVLLLKEKTGLNKLTYPEPISKCSSYKYWTVCKGHNRPLDPREGFKVNTYSEPKPWQEYEYISLDAMLERVGFEEKEVQIHPLDKKRFELSKEEYC